MPIVFEIIYSVLNLSNFCLIGGLRLGQIFYPKNERNQSYRNRIHLFNFFPEPNK
jgi:hypothetical protein